MLWTELDIQWHLVVWTWHYSWEVTLSLFLRYGGWGPGEWVTSPHCQTRGTFSDSKPRYQSMPRGSTAAACLRVTTVCLLTGQDDIAEDRVGAFPHVYAGSEMWVHTAKRKEVAAIRLEWVQTHVWAEEMEGGGQADRTHNGRESAHQYIDRYPGRLTTDRRAPTPRWLWNTQTRESLEKL